jgi:hypothetical protein
VTSRPPYSPAVDGRPYPGEIVWTWVSFEQDSGSGKDRPVLVLALDGARITALPMRTKNVDRDSDRARRKVPAKGPVWMDLGVGDWDRQGRPSEIQLNRVLTVSIYDVRRNGSELDDALFDEVQRASRRYR